MLTPFISQDAARTAVEYELRQLAADRDGLFAPDRGLRVGTPLRVHDLDRQPAYWLVPILDGQGAPVGMGRVTGSGSVAALGRLGGGGQGDILSLSPAEAARLAEALRRPGEQLSPPLLVYDRVPGRESYWVEASESGRPTRWLFVSPAGVSQRLPGPLPPSDSEG